MAASRKEATTAKKKPESAPSKNSTPAASNTSALVTSKTSALASSKHLAVPTAGESIKAIGPKSAMATPKRGAQGSSAASGPCSKDKKNTKKVTISEYVEYEGEGDYEDYEEGDYDDYDQGYEGYEEGYEGDERYDEDWEGYEDYEDYEGEYEDEYYDGDYESEESEGWNVFDPWFLWNDLDGSRMAANFKRFHALNRDMAPERLRKKINYCPYDVPYVIKKEASCPMLFEDFLELPDNIREKIWEYALPQESRVVVIYQHSGAYVKCAGPDILTTQGFGGKRPVLLRVNHESREVAKRFYKLSFGAVDGKPKYFNFGLDALHLWGVGPDFVDRMPYIKDDLAKVQKLAIHGAGLIADEDQYARLRHFTSLKTLLIEKPSDIDLRVRDMLHNKVNHAARQLLAQFLTRRVEAEVSALVELESGHLDADTQIDEAVETDSVSNGTLSEESVIKAATPDGISDELPEVGALIDQALADISADVDMLIDEAMADISSIDAIHIQPASPIKDQIITELVIDFRTFMYTCSKIKKPVKDTNDSMADTQEEQSIRAANYVMDLDDKDHDAMVLAKEVTDQVGAASTPVIDKTDGRSDVSRVVEQRSFSSSPADSAMVIDGTEQAVVRVPKAIVNDVEEVADFGAFMVIWEKAEDILEIAIMPSQWPKRVNKAKKFWKWNMAKRRADDIWGTGVYSNQIPHDYGREIPVPVEVPAPPLSPKSGAARAESNKGLAVHRLQEATDSSLCCACADRATPASNNNRPPIGPLQGSDGDYIPIGHLAPAEVKTAVNAIISNAANPNQTQYISPYAFTHTTNGGGPAPAGHSGGRTSSRISPYTTQGRGPTENTGGSTSSQLSPYAASSSAENNARGFSQPPASYISPYAPLASGHYTHTAPDPIRYVSPYGPPAGGGAGGSFGIIRLSNHGRSDSAGGSSNGGTRGPMAGPIPTPRYTLKPANNTGGGTAYYISSFSRNATANSGRVDSRGSSSAPRGIVGRGGARGFANDGPGSGRGDTDHGTSVISGDDDIDTDEEIS
ncbi:hypothetical protein DL98DRAFT_654289 [Cadophora sp. DSE1049]|nr:hypothetical protein DL98DRAFT_654289 [Cadophora sp. DSE1049]